MSALTLIEDLRQRGFALAPEGDGIRVTPASALTDADRARIAANKAALLELLTTDPRVSLQPCPNCGGATLSESGDGWQRRWCPSSDHRFSRFDGLGSFTRHAARREFEARLARHDCPDCGEPMLLQFREPESWFCPACRLWAIEGVLQ